MIIRQIAVVEVDVGFNLGLPLQQIVETYESRPPAAVTGQIDRDR